MSIRYKLFFAILFANFFLAVAMYAVSIHNFKQGFIDYLSQVESEKLMPLSTALAREYEQQQSLQHLAQQHRRWRELIHTHVLDNKKPSPRLKKKPEEEKFTQNRFRDDHRHDDPKEHDNEQHSEKPRDRVKEPLPFDPRLLLLDSNRQVIIGNKEKVKQAVFQPVLFDGQTIGYLGIVRRQEFRSDIEKIFVDQQQQSFAAVLVILLLLSVAVAFPLASTLVRPINNLVRSTHDLTSGNYSVRTDVQQQDELGQLARDFNVLAKTLEENRKARQQWIADISHELRTPLAVLKGEIEAIQDGIRPMDSKSMESLAQEIEQLNCLVADLYQLTLSDMGGLSYKKVSVDVAELVDDTLEFFASDINKQQIEISKDIQYTGVISADRQRLLQLFSNLMQNSLRYTDKGGKIVISMAKNNAQLKIIWSDSSPGVSEEDLPRLFERLYRADNDSRNRQVAGAGLGLAICANIVEAHQGTISAGHSSLGGLQITITLAVD